jgi:hypothetical protein
MLFQAFDAEQFSADRLLIPVAYRRPPMSRHTSECAGPCRTGRQRGSRHEPTRRHAFNVEFHVYVLLDDLVSLPAGGPAGQSQEDSAIDRPTS